MSLKTRLTKPDMLSCGSCIFHHLCIFQKSKIRAHQNLANILEKEVTKVTWNDPLDDLVQDKLIVLGFSMDYDAFDPRISCQLYTIGPPLFYSYNGIAVQKRKSHPK